MADAFCYTAETNTPLESNYTPIKMFKSKTKQSLSFGFREGFSRGFSRDGSICLLGHNEMHHSELGVEKSDQMRAS